MQLYYQNLMWSRAPVVEQDRYKATFNILFGHYEWNIMLFRLKDTQLDFQNFTDDSFNQYTLFAIVSVDDVLIYLHPINQTFRYIFQCN